MFSNSPENFLCLPKRPLFPPSPAYCSLAWALSKASSSIRSSVVPNNPHASSSSVPCATHQTDQHTSFSVLTLQHPGGELQPVQPLWSSGQKRGWYSLEEAGRPLPQGLSWPRVCA